MNELLVAIVLMFVARWFQNISAESSEIIFDYEAKAFKKESGTVSDILFGLSRIYFIVCLLRYLI